MSIIEEQIQSELATIYRKYINMHSTELILALEYCLRCAKLKKMKGLVPIPLLTVQGE